MQGIYNYIPETNHVYRVYSVAAVLYLQFVLRVMFCTFTLALSIVLVQCPNMVVFCGSLISCFPGILLLLVVVVVVVIVVVVVTAAVVVVV